MARATLAETTNAIDSLRAAATAEVTILPYQLEPALAVAGGHAARVLIADEVGLGKTIQAGFIISEALTRRADAHVLVLCPAGLREQWQGELRRRFHLAPAVLDSSAFRRLPLVDGANPWTVHPLILTSTDFVKRPEVVRALEPVVWDLLVVDEAHGIAGASDRHEAAAHLARRARVVVLISATPHSGDGPTFARLTSVGDLEHAFPLCVFRRTRTDVSIAGSRRTRWFRVRPTLAEAGMHRALMAYVRQVWHTPASAAARLAMIVLTRRACSCASSLARTLERRLALLDTFPTGGQLELPLRPVESDDEPDVDVGAPGLEDRATERRTIEGILGLAHEATAFESKMRCLARLLRRSSEPAIVFTEYRDTLRSVQQHLARFDTCLLHGGLTATERAGVIREFTSGSRRVLLATDAASEGLNLQQRCRLVIHLEVPWTPTRIEQRVGRVDRIGQSRVVHQVHLVGRNTIEETHVAEFARRQSQIASTFDGLFRGSPSDRETAEYVIGGDARLTEAPPSRSSSLVAGDLRERASAEAARLITVRQLRPPGGDDASARLRPFVTFRRRTSLPLGWWALRLECTDPEGQLVWETLVGVSGSHGWTRQPARGDVRRLVDASWNHIRKEIAIEHQRIALMTSRSLQATLALLVTRERAVACEIEQSYARIAADLLQPGLFDRRTERQATAQREVVDHALRHCHERLAELERHRNATFTTLRPAFSLIAW
jgi:superfamily II DNA or RNA helicase